MAVLKLKRPLNAGSVTIQLNLVGVIVFSVALVLASALVTYGLVKHNSSAEKNSAARTSLNHPSESGDVKLSETPPWGDLMIRDIDLQQPEEYVAYETGTNHVETWLFTGMAPAAVKTTMQGCGFTDAQIGRALSAPLATYTNACTVILPDDDLIFSLTPAVRTRLYSAIAQSSGSNGNELFQYPFCFPGNTFEARIDHTKVSEATLTVVRKLLYPRGDAQCFSDLRTVLKNIPGENE